VKKSLLALSLLGGVVFAQDKPLDPCGSPNEVFSKHLLDQCYKGYFEAIMEAKKNAEEALRLAREANNKISNLEKKISSPEKTVDDKALMEAKKNAEEALRLATEANNKISELEKRVSSIDKLAKETSNKVSVLEKSVSSFEKIADDHERRIRALEGRRPAAPSPPAPAPQQKTEDVGLYRSQLEEVKKNADEALRLAREANSKVGDLEKRVSSLERTVNDHERRIRALEGREPEAPQPKTEGVGPYRWQLEEVGTVYFDFNKFDIKKSEAEKLDEIANKIKESGREVLVVGFADKRGPSNYNFNLSMWRAQMTASYLARKGVDIGKIRVAAYGKEVADLLGKDFKAQRAVKIFLVY
jgi:peptidoglycan-associated lipoprotein